MLFVSILFSFFIYFSTIFKLQVTTSLLLEWIKLAETLDFTLFNSLLIFDIYLLACEIITSALFMLIEIIIYFLERFLVIILNFGFFDFFNIVFRSLYVWIVVWARSLKIQQLNFLEVFGFGQNALA